MPENRVNQQTLQARLFALKAEVGGWLDKRRCPDEPFGRFSFCEGAMAPYELNASTGGIELWVMLGLPMDKEHKQQATAVLQEYQQPENGLVYDPAWEGRYIGCDRETARKTSFFFTMTAASALEALKTTYRYPIRYLTESSPDELVSKTTLTNAVGGPYGIGNYGTLLRVNAKRGDQSARCILENL